MNKEDNKDIEVLEEREDISEEAPVSSGKATFIIIGITLLLFLIVMLFTDILGNQFGKTVETVALIVIALLLGIFLYKSNRSK